MDDTLVTASASLCPPPAVMSVPWASMSETRGLAEDGMQCYQYCAAHDVYYQMHTMASDALVRGLL